MDTHRQSHSGATPTGGSGHLIPHQNVQNHGTSRHPTNDEEAEPLVPHEHARINLNRREGSEPVAVVYQEGRQGFPAVRFQVPRQGSTATAASPGGLCNCDCGHRTFGATMSSSTMQPPPPPPKGPTLSPVSELKQEEEEAKRVEEDVKRVEVKPVEDVKPVEVEADGKAVKEGVVKLEERDVKEGEVKPVEKEVKMVETKEVKEVQTESEGEAKGSRQEGEQAEEIRIREAVAEKSPWRAMQESRAPKVQQESSTPVKERSSSSDHGSPTRPPHSRASTRPHSRVLSGTILLDAPLPSLPRDDRNDGVQDLRRARTSRGTNSTLYSNRPLPPSRQHSGIDWIVPVDVDEKSAYSRARRKLTVGERLQPTLDMAKECRDKFAKKARYTGYAQNAAIGLQVLLGSLTTGLSAVATTGRQMAVQTTILGGLTTIVASYLAKTRNSDEPEASRVRVKDLDKFIRTLTAFLLDYGHSDDPAYDSVVEEIRSEFEELLGNGAIEKHQPTHPAPDATTKV